MAEFRVRKEAANKCMRKYDQWTRACADAPTEEQRTRLEAMAEAARECAADIARCTLDHPYVSIDPQKRRQAWSEPESA